jgi:hypothetical protein
LLSLRMAVGKTQVQAAQVLSSSSTKIAKMETGWVPMRDPDIRALCEFYGVEDSQRTDRLLELARLDRERRRAKGWWQAGLSPGGLAEYIAMEDVATHVRQWQVALIPGLFQTPDYLRSIAVRDSSWRSPDDIERSVDIRMRRQERLTADKPLHVHAVIWEAALRQLMGGPEVMRGQLERLLMLAKYPHVHIQILPFAAGGHPCVAGSFNIVSFAESDAMDVVHMDTNTSTLWVENTEQSVMYTDYFDRTARLSLSPHDSVQLIERIQQEI